MTKIESVVVELGNDLLRKIEIDTLQISENCLRNCLHCSVSPDRVIETINMAHFKKYVLALARINEETGNDLIANYLHTSIDSDPLFHPELATIVETLIETTGKKFYFLTQGWYGINQFQKNAEWIANNPEKVEKVSLTLTKFPTNPSSIEDIATILIRAVDTFGKMPVNKFIISPQYNDEVDDSHPHSRKQVEELLDNVLYSSGYNREDFKERIFFRPIIGLGRAGSILNVKSSQRYRIEAEQPVPVISSREDLRPYSGMVNMQGELLVMRAPRAILNRGLDNYVSASTLKK